jgi:hypothetical protein
MKRALLLPTLAAALAGCYVSNHDNFPPPCNLPVLHIYWTPGPAPNGGFVVPGLVAAGFPSSLNCTDAGVAGVQLTVGGVLQGCSSAGFCVDANTWKCSTGGLSIDLGPGGGGNYSVRLDALDAAGNLKYQSFDNVLAASCNQTATGIFPAGLGGALGFDYAFVPTANCDARGSTIEWDLRSGLSTPYDVGSIPCGQTNPFPVKGGALVLAGVYTLVNMAEVVGGTQSIHAFCSSTPFVHAGPESGALSLLVDMPVSTTTCF